MHDSTTPQNPRAGRSVFVDQVVVGLAMIAAGLFVWLELGDRLGSDLVDYWPLLIVAVGLAKMTGGRKRADLPGGLMVVAAGTLMLLHSLWILRWSDSWPLMIVVAGLSYVLAAVSPRWDCGRSAD